MTVSLGCSFRSNEIGGHKYNLIRTVPDFIAIEEIALAHLLENKPEGTFAFRKSAELWVKRSDKVQKIEIKINKIDGYLLDELIREYSLGCSLLEFYDCDLSWAPQITRLAKQLSPEAKLALSDLLS
ncbi:MAG: hypothetical protein ACK4HV_05540 [Parachlamydiaceae bacterium]